MSRPVTPGEGRTTEEGGAAAGGDPDFHAVDPESPEGRRTLRKAIAASALGNATEWFDYSVYAAVSSYITASFFPGEYGSVLTWAGLAISFLLRPLGGFVWGPLGDRLGRRTILAMTILMMAGATTLIGVLPTHAAVGALAPILLILLRVVQGFSTGGEYGGAATFMAEYSPDNRRGFFGSFLEFGTLAGTVAGTGLVLILQGLLSEGDMASWGWRLPFFVALPLGLVGWFLRTKLDETPVFEEELEKHETETSAWKAFTDLVSGYWPQILTMFGMVVALNIVYYTLLTYQETYLHEVVGVSKASATGVMFVGQLAMMALIPFAGATSDRIGRKPMWWTSLIGLFVLAIPMYLLMKQGFVWAIVGYTVLGLLFIPQLSTISATFPAMFPTTVRYAGFAISYNLATAIFGGTAPLANEYVRSQYHWDLFAPAYMMVACVIGMVAVLFLRETAGVSLRGAGIPGRPTAISHQKD